MREPLRRRARGVLLRGLTRSLDVLPETVVRTALRSLASSARWTSFDRTIRSNLALAYGDTLSRQDRAKLSRRVRQHVARIAAEWIRLSRGPREAAWLEKRVRFDESVSVLDALRARGRGVLVTTAHLGNWELLAVALRHFGYEGAVVGRRRRTDPSYDWLFEMRASWGIHTLAQDDSPRMVLRHLSQGQLVGLLCDLEVRRLDGVFLPFFGSPALTMTAPAAFARASGLPLLPARCVRATDAREDDPYVVKFEEPLELDRTLGRREALADLCARLNTTFERWIRETPEQWAWHQPRWRTRPGERTIVPLPARRAQD